MNKKTIFWRIALATITALVIAVTVIRNTGPKVGFVHRVSMIPHFDKLGHFFLMGLISMCAVVAFTSSSKPASLKRSLGIMSAVMALSLIEEFTQLAFPSRTFSYLDVTASVAGIFTLGMIGHLISRQISAPA